MTIIATYGQTPLGTTVGPVEIRDANDEPVMLPDLGKKHLLIFYVDPDHANQNKEFQEKLEQNQINSPNIYAFGVINLKDAPMLPNSIVRMMIRKKAKQTNTTIYTDPERILAKAWNLGDVGDKFVVIFVTKDKEIAFYKAGRLSDQEQKQFYAVIDKYR